MKMLVVLLILHSVGGHDVVINQNMITSMVAKNAEKSHDLYVDGVNCQINLADGKFLTVVESCEEVKRLIGEIK